MKQTLGKLVCPFAIGAALFLAFLVLSSLEFGPVFSHDLAEGPRPWKHENFDVSDDRFMFAVHSDLTGGERPRIFEVAMAQLALFRPEFVINVGDLVQGGGDRDQFVAQWESYDSRAEKNGVPVFRVGGNHDVQSETGRAVWAERNGPLYYHFRYRDVLFLVLDSEDIASEDRAATVSARDQAEALRSAEGSAAFETTPYAQRPERTEGTISDAQASYFEAVIAANDDVRHTFIFVHKQVWYAEATPFSRIEAALSDRPYTVFSGHYHGYIYNQRYGRDYLTLSTTGGWQEQDGRYAVDHITLVTVTGEEVEIANLLLSGILDKTGQIPLEGGTLCFEATKCEDRN